MPYSWDVEDLENEMKLVYYNLHSAYIPEGNSPFAILTLHALIRLVFQHFILHIDTWCEETGIPMDQEL